MTLSPTTEAIRVKSCGKKPLVLGDIYTDASTKQLGAVITQDNRPIAFFSRKLSDAQSKYTVTELELLAIVCTSNAYKGC